MHTRRAVTQMRSSDHVVVNLDDLAAHRAKRKAESLAEGSEAKARRAEARENHAEDEDYMEQMNLEELEAKEKAEDKAAGRKQTLITHHFGP